MISFNELTKIDKVKEQPLFAKVLEEHPLFSKVQEEQSTLNADSISGQGTKEEQQDTLIKNEASNSNFQEELFKKGDFVKIIYKENSKLNMYKAYNGEIRTYYKGGVTATIQLEACNSAQTIMFPIDHFIKRNFNDPKEKSIGILKEYFVDGERHVTVHY